MPGSDFRLLNKSVLRILGLLCMIFLITGVHASGYPAKFDLREVGRVSPVKDQGNFGTCWAFATYGSLESTLMPATPAPDFSEKNLVNLAGFDYPPSPQDGGGQAWMSTAYLTRWNGPVNETTDPYPSGNWTNSSTYPPVVHVQKVILIPFRANRSDTGDIKYALTTWGAVYSSFYWGNSFYNSSHASYYQPPSASDPPSGGGHAVTIVGWDDTYAATNFTTSADGPGAWIVKNSWGTGFADAGYFYVSYYDKYFGSAPQPGSLQPPGTSRVGLGPLDFLNTYETAVFLGESTSNYASEYSYETHGEVIDYNYTTPKSGSFANVFTANSSETIKAVGFYTTDKNVPCTISIYKNPTSGPVGGTPAATFSTTLSSMGYNTVALPSGVPVGTGDKFSVVVQVTNPTNDNYIPVEKNVLNYTSGITSQSGQGYVLGNSTWTDWKTIEDNSNLCIRAYTIPPPPDPGFDSGGGDEGPATFISTSDISRTEIVNVGGGSAVTRAEMSGTNLGKNLVITAFPRSNLPLTISPPNTTVFQYLSITTSTIPGVVSQTSLDFSVPQSWITGHGFTIGDIVMMRNADGQWQTLDTYFISQKSGTVNYRAFTTGFSYFAIAYQKGGTNITLFTPVPTTLAMAEATIKDTIPPSPAAIMPKEMQTVPPVPVAAPVKETPLAMIIVGVIGVIALITGTFLVRRWWIRRQNPALFRKYD